MIDSPGLTTWSSSHTPTPAPNSHAHPVLVFQITEEYPRPQTSSVFRDQGHMVQISGGNLVNISLDASNKNKWIQLVSTLRLVNNKRMKIT